MRARHRLETERMTREKQQEMDQLHQRLEIILIIYSAVIETAN